MVDGNLRAFHSMFKIRLRHGDAKRTPRPLVAVLSEINVIISTLLLKTTLKSL